MSKHTPGPWHVWRGDLIRATSPVRPDCAQVLARTEAPWLKQFEGESDLDLYTRSRKEQSVNARLMAAAPDLFEALSEIVETLAKEAPGTPLNNHRFDALGAKARAALAKTGAK